MVAHGQGRILWMLMLMAPGEDFLDVIAKVLPPTAIIDYKLLLWHPDILGSIAQP